MLIKYKAAKPLNSKLYKTDQKASRIRQSTQKVCPFSRIVDYNHQHVPSA